MSATRLALLALASGLALLAATAHADAYRCVDQGKTRYSDKPCGPNAQAVGLVDDTPSEADRAAAQARAAQDHQVLEQARRDRLAEEAAAQAREQEQRRLAQQAAERERREAADRARDEEARQCRRVIVVPPRHHGRPPPGSATRRPSPASRIVCLP
jgi:hypothetical protein